VRNLSATLPGFHLNERKVDFIFAKWISKLANAELTIRNGLNSDFYDYRISMKEYKIKNHNNQMNHSSDNIKIGIAKMNLSCLPHR